MKKVILLAAAVAVLSSGLAQAKAPSVDNAAGRICIKGWGVEGCLGWGDDANQAQVLNRGLINQGLINPKLTQQGLINSKLINLKNQSQLMQLNK